MEKLSVVIITFNEEEHLPACLTSVQKVADEILVLDSYSSDNTEKICKEFGVIFKQHRFDGYISQKNRALAMAKHHLVLSLDGDEALSSEAIEAVTQIKSERKADGYRFRRRNNYCGRWMRFTSMYPDRKIRLFDRRKATWGGYDPHDCIIMTKGAVVHPLRANILHYVFATREEHLKKVLSFSEIAAKAYYEKGRKSKAHKKYINSAWRFINEWVIRGGFLEGHTGWQFSILSARYVWLKYKKLENLYAERN